MILSAMQGFENILEDKNKYLEHQIATYIRNIIDKVIFFISVSMRVHNFGIFNSYLNKIIPFILNYRE